MGIVRVKEFEEEFEQEEIEIYALLRKVPNGAAVYSKDCLRPLAYTEANVDCLSLIHISEPTRRS